MMYCSEDCRAGAFHAYHRVECKMWPFYQVEIPNDKRNVYTLIALRTLYIGTKQGAQLEALVESLDIHRDIFAEEVDILNKPFKRDYLSTLRMLRKFEEKPSKELILLAVKAVIMLQNLSFFGNDANPVSCTLRSSLYRFDMILSHFITSVGFNEQNRIIYYASFAKSYVFDNVLQLRDHRNVCTRRSSNRFRHGSPAQSDKSLL